ncbi:MAG: hypothetical protein PVH24_05315, partial [Candidatus Zixiibacteriota bacterium]
MRELADLLGADADFYPDDFEAGVLLGKINEAIDDAGEKKIFRMPWIQYAAAAAAIVLLAGTTMIGYFNRRSGSSQQSETTTEVASYDLNNGALLASVIDDDNYLMFDDESVNLLIQDYASGGSYSTSEHLLNDLTTEELEYLQKNFD